MNNRYALEEQTYDIQIDDFSVRLWVTCNNPTEEKVNAIHQNVSDVLTSLVDHKVIQLDVFAQWFVDKIDHLATVQVKKRVEGGIEVGHTIYVKGFHEVD